MSRCMLRLKLWGYKFAQQLFRGEIVAKFVVVSWIVCIFKDGISIDDMIFTFIIFIFFKYIFKFRIKNIGPNLFIVHTKNKTYLNMRHRKYKEKDPQKRNRELLQKFNVSIDALCSDEDLLNSLSNDYLEFTTSATILKASTKKLYGFHNIPFVRKEYDKDLKNGFIQFNNSKIFVREKLHYNMFKISNLGWLTSAKSIQNLFIKETFYDVQLPVPLFIVNGI